MATNLLLARLSREDFGLLEPHLTPVELPLKKQLEGRNRRVNHIYFLESGFASVVANGSTKPSIEVGIIGREGMTGVSVVMGSTERAANETFIQVQGAGQRIPAGKLREAIRGSHSLHETLLRYAYAFLKQTTSTAFANGRSKMEERLARWLLMAQDRLDGEELPLTHEFLGLMLGTYRPGVTRAVQALEKEGLIAPGRRFIRVVNRRGLEKRSNGTYLPSESD
jgi:CRP-like cAMP-binding protein